MILPFGTHKTAGDMLQGLTHRPSVWLPLPPCSARSGLLTVQNKPLLRYQSMCSAGEVSRPLWATLSWTPSFQNVESTYLPQYPGRAAQIGYVHSHVKLLRLAG